MYFEYIFNPVIDKNGIINTVSVSAIDITDFKNQVIALRESEARYKGIVETQYDLIMRLDLKGNLTFVNQRMCEVLGKTYDEAIGMNFLENIHPDDVNYVMEQFANIMTPPYRTSGEVRGRTVDGWRWYHWESVAIRNEKGELAEVQGVCRDITEYKNAMLKLSDTNELLSAIMNSSPVGLVVYNFEGNITYWSKGAEKIFGWTESEVLNKNPLLPESEREQAFLLLNSLKSKANVESSNLKRYRKDGTTVMLNEVAVPLKNDSGEIIAVLGIYEDITYKINAEIENLKLSSVLNLSTGAIAILSRDLVVESVNPKFSELTGYSFDELKGRTFKDLRPPQMALNEYYKIESIIKSGIEWRSESANRSKDGNIYYENILVSPIKDGMGAISNFLLIKEDISERNKSLQELINTRLRLGTIMNSFPNLVIFEFENGFTFISANIKEVIGYPREVFFENKHFYRTIFDNNDLAVLSKNYLNWFDSDSSDIFSGRMRYRKPGNTYAWAEMFVSKTRSESSAGICGVIMDITGAKESEENLMWNETLLRAMTESTRYGYYAVDLSLGEILYVNEKFCDMWGISQNYGNILEKKIKHAQVTAMCSRSVYDANQFQASQLKYSDPSNTITFEDEVEMLSGRVLRRFSSLLKNNNGDYLGRFYLYVDITEKKLYEKMSNMQNDYKLLVEESIDPMVITDFKGDIKLVNTKLCDLTGFDKNEFKTFSLSDLFASHDENEFRVYPDDSMDGKTVINKRNIKLKNGASLSVETRSKMLPNKLIQTVFGEIDIPFTAYKANHDDGILNIYVNILTQLRLFRHGENSLSCLNRISLFVKNPEYFVKTGTGSFSGEIKQRFFSLTEEYNSSVGPQLNHIVSLLLNLIPDSPDVEFREKLFGFKNTLSINSKLLKKNLSGLNSYLRDENPDFNLSNYKNEILTSVNNIKRCIKFMTGLLETAYVTDADESLKKIAGKFSGIHENVDININIIAKEPRIIFGNLEFAELMNVLLTNSDEARTSRKKTLRVGISVLSAEGKTIIEYTDNGKGISARIKDRIFESGVTTKGKNRGFGLNFAGRIVKKYGGVIMLVSEKENGVKFVIELNPY
ncbi:MAG: PAS domain S-box protein [Ignavibacteria bacterium]|nr:PAS domain S-box protein [Ignavibacteria bacterium]